MFEGAYAPPFQQYGHYIDFLTKKTFQKLVFVDKYDFAAGVKIIGRVEIIALL